MTFPAPLSRRLFTAAVLCSAAFAAGATITFIALGVVRWREMRKGV